MVIPAHNNNLSTDNYGDTTDEHIRCRGELSCANTNMLDSNSNYLWCYGDRSCINTTESNISTVVAPGYLNNNTHCIIRHAWQINIGKY